MLACEHRESSLPGGNGAGQPWAQNKHMSGWAHERPSPAPTWLGLWLQGGLGGGVYEGWMIHKVCHQCIHLTCSSFHRGRAGMGI
jgi:hypothetical protein